MSYYDIERNYQEEDAHEEAVAADEYRLSSDTTADWDDENHPFNTGRLLGLFMKQGIEAEPVITEEGDYTPYIDVWLREAGRPRKVRLHVLGDGR